jgi:hypothetical protein
VTDPDFEELGKLWRKEPDAEEMRGLHRSAEQVMRRARLAQTTDFVLTASAAGIILMLVAYNPDWRTASVGVAAILVMLWTQIHRRRLRQWDLQSLASDPETMIDRSILRLEATLKRATFALLFVGPATILGVLFGFTVEQAHQPQSLGLLQAGPEVRKAVVAGAIGMLGGVVVHAIRALVRGRRELARLKQLREDYRAEQRGAASQLR